LFLAVSVALYFLKEDFGQLRMCAIFVPCLILVSLFYQRIILIIDDEGVSLHWPLQSRKRIKWDEIAQVRRSDAPPGKFFFIDLIASPDRSVMFNPFMFERPGDIVRDLNKHLKFQLLGDDALKEKQLSDELAAAADARPSALSGSQWLLIAAIILILIIGLLYIIK
jgi:hypothetical protein